MSYIDLAIDAFNKYKKIVKENEQSDKVFGSKLKETGFDVKIKPTNSVLAFFKPQNKVLLFSEAYAKQTFYRYIMLEYKTLLKDYLNRLDRPEYTFYATSNHKINLQRKNIAEKHLQALTNIESVYKNKNDSSEFDEIVYDFITKAKRNFYIEYTEIGKSKIEKKVTGVVSVNQDKLEFIDEIIEQTEGGKYLAKPNTEKLAEITK